MTETEQVIETATDVAMKYIRRGAAAEEYLKGIMRWMEDDLFTKQDCLKKVESFIERLDKDYPI